MLPLIWTCLAGLVSAALYTNPIRLNGPDPFIVYDDGYYYFTTTTNVDLEITRATTLWGLHDGQRKSVWQTKASVADMNTWAPEIHKIGGRWYMYFATSNQASSTLNYQGMHVLQGGASPWDPYTYKAQLSNSTLWSIDGTVLKLGGTNYMVWSCITGTPSNQHLCIAKLTNPWTLGKRVGIISAPTNDWETVGLAVNEAPQPLYYGNDTFLTYSASFCWTGNYSLALLKYQGGDPLEEASWLKYPEPVFTTSNGNYGPGHNGFFTSPDGTQTWNVFHAVQNPAGACDATRYTMALPITWSAKGDPVFGTIPFIGVALTGPSGEPGQTDVVPP